MLHRSPPYMQDKPFHQLTCFVVRPQSKRSAEGTPEDSLFTITHGVGVGVAGRGKNISEPIPSMIMETGHECVDQNLPRSALLHLDHTHGLDVCYWREDCKSSMGPGDRSTYIHTYIQIYILAHLEAGLTRDLWNSEGRDEITSHIVFQI